MTICTIVTEMAITADEKGEDIIEIVTCDENKNVDQPFDLYRNDFYLHFPFKRPQLLAFGS